MPIFGGGGTGLSPIPAHTFLANTGTASAIPVSSTVDPAAFSLAAGGLINLISYNDGPGITVDASTAPLFSIGFTTLDNGVLIGNYGGTTIGGRVVVGTNLTLNSGGTLSAAGASPAVQVQTTIAATTTASVTAPTLPNSSVLVNLGTTAATIEIAASATLGQAFRMEIKQGATARVVTLGTSVVYGGLITSYTATPSANARDLLEFIANTGSTWMLASLNQGFVL